MVAIGTFVGVQIASQIGPVYGWRTPYAVVAVPSLIPQGLKTAHFFYNFFSKKEWNIPLWSNMLLNLIELFETRALFHDYNCLTSALL